MNLVIGFPIGIHIVQLLQTGPVFIQNKPSWDAVNLELGQYVQLGSLKHWRVHAGVQYARVANESLFNGILLTEGSTSPASSKTYNLNSTYNGFGPRLGVDFTQSLYANFSAYAKG